MSLKLIFTTILILFYASSFPQETGHLNIHNYSPKEYKAHVQNWAIVQDKRGMMYFGNGDGVIEYDGTSWRVIEVPNKSTINALAIDSAGRIYVGANEEFGYLHPDRTGKMQYISLNHHIDKDYLKSMRVWDIVCVNNDVYFGSRKAILRLRNGSFKVWPVKSESRSLFAVENQMYTWLQTRGLVKIGEDSLMDVPFGDFFIDKAFNTTALISYKKVLVGTYVKGLFTYDFANDNPGNINDVITRIYSEADSIFYKHSVYKSILLNDSSLALGVLNSGCIILGKNGKVIRRFNTKNGLQNDIVIAIYQDLEDNIWMGMSQGISKVELNSPITFWNKQHGLNNLVKDIIRFNGTLYVANFGGIHYIENNQVVPLKDVNSDAYCFCNFVVPQDTTKHILLAGTTNYIYDVNKDRASIAINVSEVWCITQSFTNKSRVYIGTGSKLYSAVYNNSSWMVEGYVKGCDDDIRAIVEEKNGEIWMGTFRNGVIRIIPSENVLIPKKVIRYGVESGLPSLKNVLVYKYKGNILFATESGLYQFDKPTNTFKPDSLLGNRIGSRDVFCFTSDKSGRVYLSGLLNSKGSIVAIEQMNNHEFSLNEKPFISIPEMMVLAMYAEPNGTAWIGGTEGLYKYSGSSSQQYPDYKVLIRKVTVGKDSVVYWGNDSTFCNSGIQLPVELKESLDFTCNSIAFEFSANSYFDEKATQYQTFLQGFDDEWSNWNSETKRYYTNLPAGSYKFRVKAINVYKNESNETEFGFIISPPWYQTVWAYILYVGLFILLVYGLVFFNTRRLKAKNIVLERIVTKRTAEIQKQKEVLAVQRDEILEKNEILQQQNEEIKAQSEEIMSQRDMLSEQKTEIISSIQYALKIQKAVLPSTEIFKELFADYFVIYLPKDIVSGDFYWLKRIKNFVILVTADCTGHGVPGAFMSMLSMSLLNEIVSKSRMDTSGEILNNLRKRIKTVLHQEGKEGEQKDGLDIALCVYDTENSTMQYSGAYNSLYLIRDNSLTEYKADRQPCAVYLKEKDFTIHEISLQKNDIIYSFSDGYCDQIGGDNKGKFMSKKFREFLLSICNEPMSTQKEMLLENLENWKRNEPQLDDITIIGLKI